MSALTLLVIMGVSGAGKTTVGELIAKRLDWPFVDGDDLQPLANIDKMRSGAPLTDEDRGPWLAAIGDWLDVRIKAGEPGVVACSALKRALSRQAPRRPPAGAHRLSARIGKRDRRASRPPQRPLLATPVAPLASSLTSNRRAKTNHAIVVDIEETPEAVAKAVIERLP